MSRTLDVGSSVLASQMRGWHGCMIRKAARKQPQQPLQLYEFEASPYCRLVREALTELDLDATIYPCPKNGERFRAVVRKLGGKTQFPFLVDPNTGTSLYESAEIVRYLGETYGGLPRNPGGLRRRMAIGGGLFATLSRASRGLRGFRARASTAPKQALELFSFEGSPYSRLVREVLCELELPYLLHNTGKARWQDIGPPAMRHRLSRGMSTVGRNRIVLEQRTGRVQVPYLIDPNSGVEMYESADIIAYLEKTYGA
ncbi:MAG: glutathione S-transferase N-terminal domain-containing protein [Stenotrophobium sp.]